MRFLHNSWTACALLAISLCGSASRLDAQQPPAESKPAANPTPPVATAKPLVVATKNSPPFSFRNSDGEWTGISIELWRHAADKLNLKYEFRELTLPEIMRQLTSREADVAVAALSVTAERHRQVEFCHPHFTTGLGIAVSADRHGGVWTLLQRIVSTRLLIVIGGMIGVVLACGALFWVFERERNAATFGGRRSEGLGMGVWWSLILLLGHKGVVPVSLFGRLVAAAAMIASIMLLSLLTGIITSVLTVQQLESDIARPSDLRSVRTVTVAGSTSAQYLRQRRIRFQEVDSAEAAMRHVIEGRADAVVYDQALLRYLVNSRFAETMQVLPVSFHTQEYAIALVSDSPLRKPLNEVILRFRAGDAWDDLLYRYLGQ